jgi:hypothetical protein
VAAGASPDWAPANDALLVRLVRAAHGKDLRGWRLINVNSCSSVVTLHRVADSDEERDESGQPLGRCQGVRAVANRLTVIRH